MNTSEFSRDSENVLAIDVVLLPNPTDMEKIIDLNRQLDPPGQQPIILGREYNLPHLSLWMGGVKRGDLPEMILQLEEEIMPKNNLQLVIAGLDFKNQILSLNVSKHSDLQLLHERIYNLFTPFKQTALEKSAIIGAEVTDNTFQYIQNYTANQSKANFWPHFTLGYTSTVKPQPFSEKISCDRIGIFQLGNHCTCRLSLWQESLAGG